MIDLKNTAVQSTADTIRIQDVFYACIRKWYWFVISLAVSFAICVYYILTTPPVYTRTASILIKDESTGKSSSASMESFSDLGLFTSNVNVNSEIVTLKSRDLMREVVSRLHLNMDYHIEGRFMNPTIYGEQLPVRVEIIDFPENGSAGFTLRLEDDGKVSLSDFEKGGEDLGAEHVVAGRLNDSITSPIGKIMVTPSSYYAEGMTGVIYVSHNPLLGVSADFASRLNVALDGEKSNVITLSLQDMSVQRADEMLNTLISVYNENWVKDKNQIAISTSMFINDRLRVIEGDLGNVDNDISSFKSEHLLPDVQAAANMYMAQANEVSASITALNNQVYMTRYIKGYLTNESNRFQLLPVNSGIDNQNIASQINEYNEKLLERNGLLAQSSIKNPLVVEMDASLSAMRLALATSIDNQLVALNEQIKSLRMIGGQATSKIASNPEQSKYLLSVERQQKVKEALYLYLLQKREENELSQAFTAYNTRIITMPGGSMIPTAPVKKNIFFIAFVLGLMVPSVIIFIFENMNTKVRGRKDLERLSLPFVGEIPLASKKKNGVLENMIVVREKSRNVINEAFRVVRTNIEFMLDNKNKSNVIMLTSANPGSGKTFLTYNLALCFAIKGKKVLVIDLDLRKASMSDYVGKPQIGISNYLAGKTETDSEIIYHSADAEMLSIIPVGTIPPNPTELLFNEKLDRLIDALRNEYDYIFIDCPPVEIIADAAIINKLVDNTLFVIRAGLMERSMLSEIQNFYTEHRYKNLSVLLNGTEDGAGRYGYKYGYKYGYAGDYLKDE